MPIPAKRGRKSSASFLSVVRPVEIVERQQAPEDLTEEEAEIWRVVVSDQPADWFSPSTRPLLSQFCRHTIQARRVAEMIERAVADPEMPVEYYERLLAMQAKQTGALKILAASMRISQQATTNHRGNKRPSAPRKPWG